jgi:ketosteroid isomerase-like protein
VETRELLDVVFDAANRRDLDAIVAHVDPSFAGEVPSSMSAEPDTYKGHDGIRRYFESFWEIVDDLTFELEDVEQVGAWTVVSVHPHGVGRSSGLTIEDRIALTVQARDGKLTRLRTHPGATEARAWVMQQVS